MNFYAVLGISRHADANAIRNAYKDLARRYHPDRGAGSSSEMFRELNLAYQTLINPEKRRAHDESIVAIVREAPVSEPMSAQPRAIRTAGWRQEDPAVFGRRQDENEFWKAVLQSLFFEES